MRKHGQKIIALMLTVSIIFSSSIIYAKSSIDMEYIEAIADIIKESYIYEVNDEELTEGAIKGLFYNLDPYSNYYTKEEYKKLSEQLTGEMEEAGIGVRIIEHNGYIKIIDVVKDSSSEKAGIKAEDIIVSVNDEDINGMPIENSIKLIKGQEGSKVKIGVIREGEEKILYFDIVRTKVVFNPIQSKTLDKNIGYIKIEEFNQHSFTEVSKALGEFESKGIYKIVFDVRNNPGGSLNEVVKILRLLLPKGPIVHIEYSTGEKETYDSFNTSVKYETVVLTNKNSASAAEIFAGAIKERGVGKVIGTKTYGKGSVQDILELKRGGAIKLTVAEYFTPNHNKVNGIGITPDIIVEDVYNKEGKDLALEEAMKIMKEKK